MKTARRTNLVAILPDSWPNPASSSLLLRNRRITFLPNARSDWNVYMQLLTVVSALFSLVNNFFVPLLRDRPSPEIKAKTLALTKTLPAMLGLN